jgi:hypothetical protein
MSINLDDRNLDLGAAPKLNLASLRQLEYRLGLKRGYLRALAATAGGHYDPFIKPEKHRPFQEIFKKSKTRIIDNPDQELRDVQKRVYRRLLRPEILPEYIRGGVKDRNLLDNAKIHGAAALLVTVDIASFFPSVTNEYVHFLWRHVLNCSRETAMLLAKLTSFERHLPQGAATSTPLANILICAIDKRIREECARIGVRYSTWVDDFAFSGDNARQVIPTVISTLRKAGLKVSRRKIKVMGATRRKLLNGITLGRNPGVPRESLSRIRSGIHKLATGEVAAEEHDGYLRSLVGRIRQAETINANQARRARLQLIEVLERGTVARVIKRYYLEQLRKPVPIAGCPTYPAGCPTYPAGCPTYPARDFGVPHPSRFLRRVGFDDVSL